jgi:hypothetical protein
MKPSKPFLLITLVSTLSLLLAGCAPAPDLPQGVDTPCDLESKPLGSQVQVGGQIEFLDDSLPNELYADLEAEGCRVGIILTTAQLELWGIDARSLQRGAQLLVQGQLTEAPLPARPDEFQLIVELDSAPQTLNEAQLASQPEVESALAPLSGPTCDFSSNEVLQPLLVSGELLQVDQSAAAGVAAELERQGCHVRLWVERRYWDEWPQADRDQFSSGQSISVEGLLTYVLGEAVIDIADPPQ